MLCILLLLLLSWEFRANRKVRAEHGVSSLQERAVATTQPPPLRSGWRDRRGVAGAAPQLGLRTSLEPRRRIALRRRFRTPTPGGTDGPRSPASDSCRE